MFLSMSLFVLLFESCFTRSDCMPDLFPKKIYGDATDYFNLSSFQPVLIFSFFFRKIIASKPRLKSLQLQEQVFFN